MNLCLTILKKCNIIYKKETYGGIIMMARLNEFCRRIVKAVEDIIFVYRIERAQKE